MSEEQDYTRLLGIDFGLKRIGLALTDPLMTFAYPYKTISNAPKMWDDISRVIREQNIIKIVLGFPLKESGERGEVSKEVEKFKAELEKREKIEVILIDERYSSSIAQERIMESVSKKSKRRDKGLVDMNAAAVILQDYLESQPGTSR